MNNIFSGLFSCVRIKKAYFVCLIFFTIIAVVLGVIAAINFGGGVYAVDLEHISYVKFLKGDCGFMSLIFNLILSLSVFFIVIYLCNFKSWLVPLAILFYLYCKYQRGSAFGLNLLLFLSSQRVYFTGGGVKLQIRLQRMSISESESIKLRIQPCM